MFHWRHFEGWYDYFSSKEGQYDTTRQNNFHSEMEELELMNASTFQRPSINNFDYFAFRWTGYCLKVGDQEGYETWILD